MSGKRQHFIPQFLQRGWADYPLQSTPKIKTYTASKPPFIQPVANAAAENKFYENQQGVSADDEMTTLEGKEIAPRLNALRNGLVRDVSIIEAGVVINHFATRTKNFRAFVSDMFYSTLDEVTEQLTCKDALLHQLKACFDHPDVQAAVLEKAGVDATLIQQVISSPVGRHKVASLIPYETFDQTYLDFHAHLNSINKPGFIEDIIIKAYKEILSKPHDWKAMLKGIQFRLIDSTTPIILGDSCSIFNHAELGWTPYPERKSLDQVWLPLSRYRGLWGFRRKAHRTPNIEILNSASSACAHSFFLSHKSDCFEHLTDELATSYKRHQEATIKSVTADFKADLFTPQQVVQYIKNKELK